jgi:wobble nucleotide-excising tRNase
VLQKISRLKHLGVFADYTWEAGLPAFERFNVIYGDNGSGKTTLSRLLGCLNAGKLDDFPHLEYKIDSQSGELSHGTAASRKIRVFNADYVQLNIGQLDGNLKPILVIGEENKALAEALATEQAEVDQRRAAIAAAEARIASHEQARGKKFTDIARTISESMIGGTLRSYRRGNAESAYSALSSALALTEDQLNAHRATLRQDAMEQVRELSPLTVDRDGKDITLAKAGRAFKARATDLCPRSAVSDAIARLRDNPDIALWVEQGRTLHAGHGHSQCEFCAQPVPESRWNELAAHFSTEDQQLKDEIEHAIEQGNALRTKLSAVVLPDRMALYSDFRERYDAAREVFGKAVLEASDQLDAAETQLKQKLTMRSSAMQFGLDLSLDHVEKAMDGLSQIVRAHNEKANAFDDAKGTARTAIEAYHLSSIKPDVEVCDRDIAGEKQLIEDAESGAGGNLGLGDLQAAIDAKQAQLSSAHKAGAQLTAMLRTFLGRSELVFHSANDGYRLQRNGKPAKKLSEGERTAIAFIYFIVQLGDQNFDLADGVVVIDDPVSSLDSSSVYQAFAFLKNAVKDAKQVFLLTHSFGFLRLVLDWLKRERKGKKQYYMLVCQAAATGRQSRIAPLDQTLIDHPTEYHFLFKTLHTFEGDGTIAQCYYIPNVARKVLETFLDFYVPGDQTVYGKLDEVSFDANKKTAIYKFTNDNSHFTGQGFEPGLVQESQKNVTYLLEMIAALAPQHYEGMKAVSA